MPTRDGKKKLVFDVTEGEYEQFRMKAKEAGMTSVEYFRKMRAPTPDISDQIGWYPWEFARGLEEVQTYLDSLMWAMDQLNRTEREMFRDACVGYVSDINESMVKVTAQVENLASSKEDARVKGFRQYGENFLK